MSAGSASTTSRTLAFLGALVAAVPVLIFSAILFQVWADPLARADGDWVRFGVGVMLLEFVLLHSGAFMGAILGMDMTPGKRALGFGAMVVVYGLMAWGFAVSTDSPGLLWLFAAVVAGRTVSALTHRHAGMAAMLGRSVVGVVCYLLVVMASVMLPIPEWGITQDIVREVYPDRGDGVWEQEPHRAIAGAAVYFALMGLAELFLLGPNWAGIGEARSPREPS